MIRQLQTQIRQWADYNFPRRVSWHQLLCAVEELGELAHAHLKAVQGIRTDEDHNHNKQDAIADVIISLIDYCNCEDIDLQSILEDVWSEVSQRDWQRFPIDGLTK